MKLNVKKHNKINPREIWLGKEINGSELMGMRLLRKKTRKEMSEVTGLTKEEIRIMEDEDMPVTGYPDITRWYMKHLNCNYNHVLQFRSIVNGNAVRFIENRHISANLKKQVNEKYNNKCAICSNRDRLHIHHKKPYSEGGLTELDNLELLCASCHAEEHKEGRAYHLLKAMAEG